MFGLRYPSIATLELDQERCNGCLRCQEVCPHAVFVVEDKLARIVDREACMECGACALNCKEGAIRVESGVGCANAIMKGTARGPHPTSECSSDGDCCC